MPRKQYDKEYTKNYYLVRRRNLTELLGGSCVSCGNKENLEFDHIDPKDKSFSVGKLLNYSWEKILEEAKKCQLLCNACHKSKSIKEIATGVTTQNFVKGTEVHGAKLNEEQVREIKILLSKNEKITAIANKFNVSRGAIRFIRVGRNWKHVSILEG